jgi:hypothetical protein
MEENTQRQQHWNITMIIATTFTCLEEGDQGGFIKILVECVEKQLYKYLLSYTP